MTLRTYLRAMKPEQRYPSTFMEALNTKLLKEIPHAPATVSERTALRWMNKLGFFKTKATKGWFTDGHERWDGCAGSQGLRGPHAPAPGPHALVGGGRRRPHDGGKRTKRFGHELTAPCHRKL
jgi:hypothetical protein